MKISIPEWFYSRCFFDCTDEIFPLHADCLHIIPESGICKYRIDPLISVILILKENALDSEGEMAAFDIVEDDKELEAVMKIFEELLEDVDLEV